MPKYSALYGRVYPRPIPGHRSNLRDHCQLTRERNGVCSASHLLFHDSQLSPVCLALHHIKVRDDGRRLHHKHRVMHFARVSSITFVVLSFVFLDVCHALRQPRRRLRELLVAPEDGSMLPNDPQFIQVRCMPQHLMHFSDHTRLSDSNRPFRIDEQHRHIRQQVLDQ